MRRGEALCEAVKINKTHCTNYEQLRLSDDYHVLRYVSLRYIVPLLEYYSLFNKIQKCVIKNKRDFSKIITDLNEV